MATGKALICKLGKHIPIEGADRIVQIDMFGETIITQKSNEEGTIGLLFDMETALSHEFASKNNMYRHSHLNEDKSVIGYLEDDKRIRPVKLKGVKCSGLWLPLSSLNVLTEDKTNKYSDLLGHEIDEFQGIKICEKYIAKATRNVMNSNKGGSVRQNLVPTFKEHIDTDQWARNLHKVQEGDLVIITEKFHGTSGRCGYLPVLVDDRNWFEKLMSKLSFKPKGTWDRFVNEYHFVVGSRRVVKSIGGNEAENKQHFYDEDLWTTVAKENFENNLKKGETVYFEIVGYTPSGELIMPSVANAKLKNFMNGTEYQEFLYKYGDVTTFSYGCNKEIISFDTATATYNQEPQFYKIFVYRITLTNEDGNSVDYSWDQVKRRCEQLGVNHVPELEKILITDELDKRLLSAGIDNYTNEESKEFPQHIREGVCIRVENGSMIPLFLKNKSFIFKVLEGIVKDNNVVDLEESQG